MPQVSGTSETNSITSTTQTTSPPSHTRAIRNEDNSSLDDTRVNIKSSRLAPPEPLVQTSVVATSQDNPSNTEGVARNVVSSNEPSMHTPTSFHESTTSINRTRPARSRVVEHIPSIRSPHQPEQISADHLGMALGNSQLLRPRSSLDHTQRQRIFQPVPQHVLYDDNASIQPGPGPTFLVPPQNPTQDPRYIAAWQTQQQQAMQSPRQVKAENMGYYFNPQQVVPQMSQNRTVQAPAG